jgi:hypothetical protein
MSVRPREAFEAAQTFSLRDALGADPTAPQINASGGGNIKFNLSGLGRPLNTAPSATTPPTPPVGLPLPSARVPSVPTNLSMRFAQPQAPAPKASVLMPAGSGQALPNLSFTQMSQTGKPHSIMGGPQAALAAKESAATRSDVMRLSAYVDELTSRLKKTQHRLDQTEAQLTRTSQVLCHERQAADQTLAGYKKDLAQAHETETKLRSDFAASKNKSTLADSTFLNSVGSALASDEQVRLQQRNLNELETKVSAMGDFKVKLESEIAKLDSLRKAALVDLEKERVTQDEHARVAAVAKQELISAQKQLSEVKVEHGSIQERLATAKVEEATLSEALSALRLEKVKAEAETASARSATRAMMLEHGEVSGKLCSVQKRVDELQDQQQTADKALQDTQLRAAEAEENLAAITAPAEVPTARVLAPQPPPAEVPAFTLDAGTSTCCALPADEESKPKEGTTAGAPVAVCVYGGDKEDKEDENSEDAENAEDAEDAEQQDTGNPAAAGLSASAPGKPPRRRAVISGALAPNRELSSGFNDMAKIPGMHSGKFASSVASLLATDAPIGLTLKRVAFVGSTHAVFMDGDTGATGSAPSAQSDPTSQMINAVVGDLKSKLTEISELQPVWRAVAPLA